MICSKGSEGILKILELLTEGLGGKCKGFDGCDCSEGDGKEGYRAVRYCTKTGDVFGLFEGAF